MSSESLILLGIALVNLVTGYLTFRAHQAIQIVEKATNSMKDALVASTAKASYAEGHDAAQLAGTDRATELASAVAEAARVLAALGAAKNLSRRDTTEVRNQEPPLWAAGEKLK